MVSLTYPYSCNSPLTPFSAAGAATYDDDAARMPRRYKRAHAIQNHLVIAALRPGSAPGYAVVVDLGAGTGNDGLEILSHSHQAFYIGIDHSHAMLARAREKMHLCGFAQRSFFLERSFQMTSTRDVARALRDAEVEGQVAVVMSALALHHYELADKRGVYALAHDLLLPGGLFVLTDLFSNGIAACAGHAFQTEINDVRAAVRRVGDDPAISRPATTLSVDHYTKSNTPQNLAIELTVLHELGFSKVDVVYRDGQLAVLAAERIE